MNRDKIWARNQLRHQRNSFVATLGGANLLNSPAVHNLQGSLVVLNDKEIIFNALPKDCVNGRIEIDLSQLANDYDFENKNHLITLGELYKSARRRYFVEGLETVKAYAKFTNKQKVLRLTPWYRMCRLIRNAFNHDFIFDFSNNDLMALPVIWRHVAIEPFMQGQDITENVLTPRMVGEFHLAYLEFIETN